MFVKESSDKCYSVPGVLMFLFNTCPRPFALASHFTRVGLVVSKCLFSIIWCVLFLISLNAVVCSSFQSNLLLLVMVFFLSSGRSGSDSSARFGMNFVRCCMLPRNERSCLSVFGLSNVIIASIFVTSGVIPLGVIVNPNHSIVFFGEFTFLEAYCFAFCVELLSNSSSCSFIVPFVMTGMSSKKANFDDIPSNVLSIVSGIYMFPLLCRLVC